MTPSYNQGPFIREAIESVLSQGYPNFEHIVIDNCSDDETPTIEVAGDYPIYFEPLKVDDLINALNKALLEKNNSDRKNLGIEFVNQYSWEKTAGRTLKVYRDIY